MLTPRRTFLHSMAAIAATSLVHPSRALAGHTPARKPPRLAEGHTVGLVNPAGATYVRADLDLVVETLAALGLKARLGGHVADRYGYLAGSDRDRAADVNAMFADPTVNAILTVRGGWGCNRILPLLEYDLISAHPKILMGYSDITSLLIAAYARTGLVTFHGPVGISTWNRFSTDYVRRVLMDGEVVTFQNPKTQDNTLIQTRDRIETITPGRARGILIGGNLSVLAAMVGSPYLPAWDSAILFLEDDGEHIYRVDRMLTQLGLAGILSSLKGLIFGKCTNCSPADGYGSLTLEEVFADHVAPLGIPAYAGAMIGHIENKFTLPLGVEVEMDASTGEIRMLESAVG